jgi:hypothetical protein
MREKSNLATPTSLTPLTTHNVLTQRLSAALEARRKSHYPEKTRKNNIYRSFPKDHLHHCDTHAQRKYSKKTSVSYHRTDTSHRNCHSTPNSSSSQEPNKKELGDNLCMNISRRMSISTIGGEVLLCPNAY